MPHRPNNSVLLKVGFLVRRRSKHGASRPHHAFLGRWPEKSVKFILRLLKNAEANADSKGLEPEELYIKNIVVQQAPVCY